MNFISSGKVFNVLLLSLIPLILTLFLGRFFCGWVCPFGTINHFFSWLFKKSDKKRQSNFPQAFNLKYLILIGLAAASLFGLHLWGWLDPFSLLTRSFAVLTSSVDYFAQKLTIIATGKSILGDYQKVSVFPYLITGLFILFITLNYKSARFFCNSLCPLGALYGLIARFGFLNLSVKFSCNSCGLCSNDCNYGGFSDKKFMASECLVCFNCAADCPSQSVETKFKVFQKKESQNVDLSRRKVIGSIVSGVLAAALIKSTINGKNKKRHNFIRPPGAVREQKFIEECTRCGQCMQACPTGFIQPAFTEAGLEGLWTPIVKAEAGYCLYECKTCTEVCPAEVLQKISLEEKKVFKIGTAVIDKNYCYTYADGINCTVCYDKCPAKIKAIKLREVKIINYHGRTAKVRQVYVNPDLCTGCGICEYICPRTDTPGIHITPEDEQRERVTGMV